METTSTKTAAEKKTCPNCGMRLGGVGMRTDVAPYCLKACLMEALDAE